MERGPLLRRSSPFEVTGPRLATHWLQQKYRVHSGTTHTPTLLIAGARLSPPLSVAT